MDSTHVFSTKAEKYARYRWSYAPEAIQTIFDVTGITDASVVADIGAGTHSRAYFQDSDTGQSLVS